MCCVDCGQWPGFENLYQSQSDAKGSCCLCWAEGIWQDPYIFETGKERSFLSLIYRIIPYHSSEFHEFLKLVLCWFIFIIALCSVYRKLVEYLTIIVALSVSLSLYISNDGNYVFKTFFTTVLFYSVIYLIILLKVFGPWLFWTINRTSLIIRFSTCSSCKNCYGSFSLL